MSLPAFQAGWRDIRTIYHFPPNCQGYRENLRRSPYAAAPQLAADGWSDLAKVNEASRDAVLSRLEQEERAAGHEPFCAALAASVDC